ncbi:aminotransferase class I/II-fold pyridoxal phosphate-dependent enzyme [Pontibacter silvestris]|uniref:Aminotransferase class I/II-fold pyridoxal phosphate-dependent enzyme n=1 Tax=Pontibacter silvestris TaxID=2305183 RepID=A0ABW4WSY7_9BACT|nr:aminotransferase class I/II-fold pyridoxal phosphate-dependent enzyme [Pontibacter silvestris]MCC9136198.1 aminotransferase class I/II-fold pyridoxal phosphate-dependent enzyme [Pontibacter silvestris]
MTNYSPGRIFLSAPHMGGHEKNYVQKAIEDNWVTTVGPNIQGFEHDICQHTNARHAVALNSGTAAIHVALRVVGVKAGDEVLCSTFTFVATPNPILYIGATPLFVDSEPDTWNMSPTALREAIENRLKKGKKPSCLLLVHLYGMPAKLKELIEIANEFEIPVIEDAAEALGSRYGGHQVGTLGQAGVFSFNGNKIVTTSGGGALVTADKNIAEQALFLATQAKDQATHYQHSQLGYNYRISNISAGIGRGQIEVLETRVKQRREIYNYYREKLQDIEGIIFKPEPKGCFSNRWLTTVLLSEDLKVSPEEVRQTLEKENIETRLLWKPMHLQPLFKDSLYYGDGLSEKLFNRGLCLPSSSNLSEEELDKVVKALKRQFEV